MTNKTNTVLYTGVTSNLIKRVWQHKNGHGSVFTSCYKTTKLVYYDITTDINEAIRMEKQIKAGFRIKKQKLIETINSSYKDLYYDIIK